MLSDIEIKQYMASDDIKIAPFNEELLEAGNYRVRLGSKLLIPKGGVHVKLGDGEKQSSYDEFDLGQHTYILKPKQFILGQTLEKISFSRKVCALLDGRSTLARLGLTVHQSSQLLTSGIVTLEFYNAGVFDIELVAGVPIGKMLFFKFDQENSRSYDDYGRYLGQPSTTGSNE